jgi:hypothetical protein
MACNDPTCPHHGAQAQERKPRHFKAILGRYHGALYDRSAGEVSLIGSNVHETLDADEAYALWVFLNGIHRELYRAVHYGTQSSVSDNDHREAAQARNATTQCSDGTWW